MVLDAVSLGSLAADTADDDRDDARPSAGAVELDSQATIASQAMLSQGGLSQFVLEHSLLAGGLDNLTAADVVDAAADDSAVVRGGNDPNPEQGEKPPLSRTSTISTTGGGMDDAPAAPTALAVDAALVVAAAGASLDSDGTILYSTDAPDSERRDPGGLYLRSPAGDASAGLSSVPGANRSDGDETQVFGHEASAAGAGGGDRGRSFSPVPLLNDDDDDDSATIPVCCPFDVEGRLGATGFRYH